MWTWCEVRPLQVWRHEVCGDSGNVDYVIRDHWIVCLSGMVVLVSCKFLYHNIEYTGDMFLALRCPVWNSKHRVRHHPTFRHRLPWLHLSTSRFKRAPRQGWLYDTEHENSTVNQIIAVSLYTLITSTFIPYHFISSAVHFRYFRIPAINCTSCCSLAI